MAEERACLFMSGPAGATVRVDPVKWWLAISRDVLVNDARSRSRTRPQVQCRRTPTFSRAR
ncbi:MAG: hypothetical protein ACRDKT_06115 [Actinomycetota bacterium]